MQTMPSCNTGTCAGLWLLCQIGIICMDINCIKQMWYSPASCHFRIVALPRPSLEKKIVTVVSKGQNHSPCCEILLWDLQAHPIPQEQSSYGALSHQRWDSGTVRATPSKPMPNTTHMFTLSIQNSSLVLCPNRAHPSMALKGFHSLLYPWCSQRTQMISHPEISIQLPSSEQAA